MNKQARFNFLAAAFLLITLLNVGTVAPKATPRLAQGRLRAPRPAISATVRSHSTLHSNTTGEGNTASGFEALYFNTTGGANTALGWKPLDR